MESRFKSDMIQPDTLLQDRYRVVQQVGKGGMGEVYLAVDERFQSRVAIKRAFFDDPEMCKAFRREAKLLNHLRHSALPKVSDHFSEGDEQFLVMEFIEGFDFAELLTRRKVPFPLGDVLRWADELLDALDYLHTQEPSVIHRDIKPPNIKLTPRGKVMLLDFGLAKGTPTPDKTASGTAKSVFGFSLNFAPLEQMQGSGTDPRSDIYSLAATLYSLLTGVRPPDALARASATIRHQPDPLRPAHLVQPQVPKSISQILQRALSQNSVMRQASAAELRAELRRAASDVAPLNSVSEEKVEKNFRKSAALSEIAGPVKPSAPQNISQSSASRDERNLNSSEQSHRSLLSKGEDVTTIDSPRRPYFSDSQTIAARPQSKPGEARASGTFKLVACLLVISVAVAVYLLMRDTGSHLSNSATSTELQNPVPSAQQVAPEEKTISNEGESVTDSSRSDNISTQPLTSHTTNEVPASNSQPYVEPSGTPDSAEQSLKGASAPPENSNSIATSSEGKPVLVIQNPTPAMKPVENNRRAEETSQQLPAARPVYPNQPPPGAYPPPPGDWRPPPPDGRRPPPPFRPNH
jgi:serine/threonine protein kinase